jgi:hypothetical protein
MTAVEWLVDQFEQVHTQRKWKEIIEQAKEMEKQQIIDAYQQGFNNAYFGNPLSKEQYYKETYNLSQQDKP